MRVLVLVTVLLTMIVSCQFVSQPVRAKDCKSTSISVYHKAVAKGYNARIATGLDDNGRAHRWVEYERNGKWRVWDEAIWYVGKSVHTASELGYTTYYLTPPHILTDRIFVKGKR